MNLWERIASWCLRAPDAVDGQGQHWPGSAVELRWLTTADPVEGGQKVVGTDERGHPVVRYWSLRIPRTI